MARRVQAALARLYELEPSEDVRDFIEPASAGERETLLLRECGEGVELSLRLAPLAGESSVDLDGVCQLIEGVSHFVYIAERAKAGRPTTQLELEIQAEVDKYVVLAAAISRLDVRTSERLRDRLYERVSYVNHAGSECGDRYRMANAVAQRFTRRLERDYLARRRIVEMREALRVFFRMGQQDKLRG